MGVSTDTSSNAELMAIYQGGENFLARMKELTDQRTAIESMLAELRLGRSAKEAFDEATALRAKASDALVKATTEAKRIVDEANATAGKTKSNATEAAEKLLADANSTNAEATRLKESAQANSDVADEISANMRKLKAEAEAATVAGKRAEDRHNKKISIISAALAEADKL